MATSEFIVAIELGSSKATGIAGRKRPDGSIEVLAYAREDAAPFIRKGYIYNIDKAAHALTAIKKNLESQLGHTIAQVYAGIGGQSLHTVDNAVVRVLDEESIISMELIDAINDENLDTPLADMCMLDVAPQEYKIDNTLYADPVGVTGTHVTGRFLNLVARTTLKKNLELSFEQAGIPVADLFVAPTALAKAVLAENELRSGCALIDFGAGTTTVQVYKNGLLRHLAVLPLGSNNLTHDIASLKMEEDEAEQLKLAYGNALPEENGQDDSAPTTCTPEDGRTLELTTLDDIVSARAEEIAANAWHQIELSGYADKLFAGLVLTGGGSNLRNLDSLMRKVSKAGKIRIAPFVTPDVEGPRELLSKDGTQNTLLALLALGSENCGGEEIKEEQQDPKPDDVPAGSTGTQIPIGFTEENLQPQAPEKPKPSEKSKPAPAIDKDKEHNRKSGWTKIFDKFAGELFSDDAMTDEKNK